MALAVAKPPAQQFLLFPPTLTALQLPDDPKEREFFPTPLPIAEFAVGHLWKPPRNNFLMLDPSAGSNGVWGEACRKHHPDSVLFGVDLPGVPRPDHYDHWAWNDYLKFAARIRRGNARFDLIATNPPFSLAKEFIEHSMPILRPGGCLILYLRQGFMAGQKRCVGFWPRFPRRAVCTSSRRPSHTGDGVSDIRTDYALYIWQRDFNGWSQDLPAFDYEKRETWTWAEKWSNLDGM